MNTTVINLGDYELSGGGKLGESYTHRSNPEVLLKLYSKQLEALGLEEHERACKVFRTSIPCPEPGELVRTEDGRLGILYKRIIGKKSYARALSEHPERLEEYAKGFADTCKKLHTLKPEPGMFPSAKEQYKKEIGRNPFLNENERDGLLRFIDGLPDADTCVHGDLHHGNVIFTPDGAQCFIDLSDFCTGTPLFDLGIIMLQTCWLPEETERELYHIGLETSRAFWKAFVPAYFGADASLDEVQAMLQPYAFLRILVTERLTGTPIGRIRPPVHKMIGL
jgi:uncharacterized protein (TIGR02172 family)